MITPAQRAEIRRLYFGEHCRRLYFGEHWMIDTIATALGVHHQTVRRALELATRATGVRRPRPSAIDPFVPFIRDTLAQYPRLRATRIHEMLRQLGYLGSAVQVRRLVRQLRPATLARVYRRVVTLPAEQAQVDWGTFGAVTIGHGVRLRHGAELFARDFYPLHPRPDPREFSPRPRGRVRGLRRRGADPGLRQPAQRRPGSPRTGRAVSPAPARTGRPLSLRPPALYAGAR